MQRKPHKTIQQMWTDFQKVVISPDAPSIQVYDMRLSFIAGFTQMIEINIQIANMPEKEGIEYLEALHQESQKLCKDIINRQ